MTRDIFFSNYLKLVAVWQVQHNIRRVRLENSAVTAFGARSLAGFARVEMALTGFPAHELFLGGDFDALGGGFPRF